VGVAGKGNSFSVSMQDGDEKNHQQKKKTSGPEFGESGGSKTKEGPLLGESFKLDLTPKRKGCSGTRESDTIKF